MKSIEQQEAVTAKVRATFATFPSLATVPVASSAVLAKSIATVSGSEEADYVKALYDLFYGDSDAELAGRVGNQLIAA